MPEIDIDKLSDDELIALSGRVSERRARLAVKKQKIEGESFDMDRIKPNMPKEDLEKAWAAVRNAVRGDGR